MWVAPVCGHAILRQSHACTTYSTACKYTRSVERNSYILLIYYIPRLMNFDIFSHRWLLHLLCSLRIYKFKLLSNDSLKSMKMLQWRGQSNNTNSLQRMFDRPVTTYVRSPSHNVCLIALSHNVFSIAQSNLYWRPAVTTCLRPFFSFSQPLPLCGGCCMCHTWRCASQLLLDGGEVVHLELFQPTVLLWTFIRPPVQITRYIPYVVI